MISRADKRVYRDSSMTWGGNMEKILRLSLANMKKHKKQTILLTLLIVFCMAITSAAIAGSIDMTSIFPRVADEYDLPKMKCINS